MRALVFVVLALVVSTSQTYAGGLIGDLINNVAPGVGTNLDNEHRRLKERNPGYKRIEEDGTEIVKRPFIQACGAIFQTITGTAIARCSNYSGRMNDQRLIQSAKQTLIDSGIVSAREFSGVQIRWCPHLGGGEGLAADRGRIYLDTSAKNYEHEKLAALLAHEMTHIRQYHRLGTDSFKCKYSQQYTSCGGCQDRGHPMEREAYDYEDRVYNQLVAANDSQSYGYRNNYQSHNRNSNYCITSIGNCYTSGYNPVGSSCYCNDGRRTAYGAYQ